MAKRFSELGIKQQDDRKIFNCQQVSITDVLNSEIEVIDFIPGMKHNTGKVGISLSSRRTVRRVSFSQTHPPLKVFSIKFLKRNFRL